MRVARMRFLGSALDIGPAFRRVTDFAARHGVGPCGPILGVFPSLAGTAEEVEAEICVPLTRLPQTDDPGIETIRLPRCRAACLLWSGPLTAAFRQRHLDLFAWLDARGIGHPGTAHQHAYISGTGALSDWTIEIRVPVGARAT